MATREEIIELIRNSPLSDDDLQAIMSVTVQTVLGNALVGAGMDLLASAVEEAETDAAQREGDQR